jgi:putative ABC transport system permease protein
MAAPLGYYLISQWLNKFAFKTALGIQELLFAGIIAFAIASITVGLKCLRAANATPVNTLREKQ